MNYKVDPGLYAIGSPTAASDVFVSASYKLSFDTLRSSLCGIDGWILVLDTDGINVWCAAGKRTFGTDELVRKITSSRLSEVVSHRRLIVPQLGAPGVAAHVVKRQTGFKVIFGPVCAADISEFIAYGYRATRVMRSKNFPLAERFVLIPMELVPALKYLAIIIPLLLLVAGFFGENTFLENAMANGRFMIAMLAGALAAGTVLTPIALPRLPGNAFSFKGAAAGLIVAVAVIALFKIFSAAALPAWTAIGMTLLSAGIASFLGMNFTGASTYTSLSGVRREMKYAVPLQIFAGVAGIVLWVGSLALDA